MGTHGLPLEGPREGEEWTIEPTASARTLYKAMQQDVPALTDIRWESLGGEGVALEQAGTA